MDSNDPEHDAERLKAFQFAERYQQTPLIVFRTARMLLVLCGDGYWYDVRGDVPKWLRFDRWRDMSPEAREQHLFEVDDMEQQILWWGLTGVE